MRKHYVMVIDDDSYSVELYNYSVEWADQQDFYKSEVDPLKALEDLKHSYHNEPDRFPDYILLDLKMPQIDGFAFIEEFELSFPDRIQHTSFIITTSSVRKQDRYKALSYDNVKDFITKPLPCNYIERLIKEGFHDDLIDKNRN